MTRDYVTIHTHTLIRLVRNRRNIREKDSVLTVYICAVNHISASSWTSLRCGPITCSWMPRSGRWQSGDCSEAPHPCSQWSSVTCATPGLSCADCANGGQLDNPSGSGAAGVLHGPDAAETEPCHTSPEASGFRSSWDPPGEGVQVCIFITYITLISS